MTDIQHTLETYRNLSASAIDSIPLAQVESLIRDLVAVREAGGRVFCIGNGGSQANVQHLVLHLREHGIFAIDLLADNASVTALANDKAYSEVGNFALSQFSLTSGDAIVAISGSGKSSNVSRTLARAIETCGWLVTADLNHPGGNLAAAYHKGVKMLTIPVNDYGAFEDASAAVVHMVERGLRHAAQG